ncbi:uroporphyrinogen-III synthase [Palleronia sp. KMU-117]|uniref:uroporphyrinogen-III synthase n=1 Tax=Palleronia sp. KMU-117 TaxID=3434108 RepID=UPI003D731D2C
MPKVPPILLLTRPAAQSERFFAQCEAALGHPVEAIVSPVIAIVAREFDHDASGLAGVIFTSENAVAALGDAPWRTGLRAWCVGRQTAEAAAAAGFDAVSADGDAADLVALILADRPEGPLLHLRGAHVADDTAARLTAGGVPTKAVVIYDQVAQPLTPAARRWLRGSDRPVLLPLFSPRSARLVRDEAPEIGPSVIPLAMSARVAAAWGAGPPFAKIAREPTANAMLSLVRGEFGNDAAC